MWQLWSVCPWAMTEQAPDPGWLMPTVRLSATATRGQTVCLAFGLHAPKRLGEVEVLAENLEYAPEDTKTAVRLAGSEPAKSEVDADRIGIRANHIDVRIVASGVQREGQAARGPDTAPVQLLVKRDGDSGPAADRVPPGPPRTIIESGDTRFFWVTINVPPYVTPGPYRGRLYASPAGRVGRYIEIALEVLPYALAPGPSVCAMFYPRPTPRAGRALIVAELRNLREHGFNSASAVDGEASLSGAIELRHLMGLRRAVPVTTATSAGEIERLARLARTSGWPRLWVMATDPALNPTDDLLAGFDRLRRTGVGVAVVCAETIASRVRGSVDAIVYPLPRMGWKVPQREPRPPAGPGPVTSAPVRGHVGGPMELYTWDCGAAGPLTNRLLAGVMLYFSGMDGVMPSGYVDAMAQSVPGAVLPSKRGPIDTVRWESFREGIYDYRYLCALQRAIHEAQNVPECAKAVADARTFLRDLRGLVKPDVRETLGVLEPEEVGRIRERMSQLWDTIEKRRRAAPPLPKPLGE